MGKINLEYKSIVEICNKNNISKSDFDKTKLDPKELNSILNDYDGTKDDLEPTAKYILERLLKHKKVHSVKHRLKGNDNLLIKIIRKKIEEPGREINKDNYKNEITDLIGIRVLHLFKEDWKEINDFIKSTWGLAEQPTSYIREGDNEDVKKYYQENDCKIEIHPRGYRSVHYLVKSNPSKTEFIAEIQVRTIFEEAWSEIDHLLLYPNNTKNAIMSGLSLILNRLSGTSDELSSFMIRLEQEIKEKDTIHKEEVNNMIDIIKNLETQISDLKLKPKETESIFSNIEGLRGLTDRLDDNIKKGVISLRMNDLFSDDIFNHKHYSFNTPLNNIGLLDNLFGLNKKINPYLYDDKEKSDNEINENNAKNNEEIKTNHDKNTVKENGESEKGKTDTDNNKKKGEDSDDGNNKEKTK